MNREEALAAIRSPDAELRLQGARSLAKSATPSDVSDVKRALNVETVPWIRSALRRAQFRLEGRTSISGLLEDEIHQAEQRQDVEGVRHETIGQVLHELTPAIGRLKLAALSEMRDFEFSKMAKEFAKIDELIDLFGRWRRVSAEPRYSDFELGELLLEVVAEEGVSGVKPEVEQHESVSVRSDRSFLKAAIANGLRNAVQSVESKKEARRGDERVTVSFGRTDRAFWVAINDEGVGLPAFGERIFKATTTTKPGHSGLGLPIALEAVRKLGGVVSLTPSKPEGARFFIEVPTGRSQ